MNEIDIDSAQATDADLASLPAEAAPRRGTALRSSAYLAPEVLCAVNPATREVIAHVLVTAPDRLPALVARARDAARAWGGLPLRIRAAALARLRSVIWQHAHEIAETIARGMGKPLIEALSFEVACVLRTLDACIVGLADESVATPVTLPPPLERYRALQAQSPRAVMCVVAPISAPFELAMTPALFALAAGNAVIVKVSSSAPLVGVLLERLFDEAFAAFPGLAQVVHGAAALGAQVAKAEGVDAVVFTGSSASGQPLQAELALLGRPAHFQFGSADPLIVCDDANLERAANATVFGRFSNNGQDCAGVKRVYVQRTVADAFIHKVMHKVRALKSGPYTNPFCELGPLANGRDLEHLRAVLQEALDQRAELVAGGFPAHVTGPRYGERRGAERQGWYWPPTVVRTVDQSMRIMKEPLFGPILPIQVFEDDGEAITLANDTPCGFDASIFSADDARAQRIAAKLRAGCVAVNDVFVHGAVPIAQGGGTRSDGDSDREPYWFPYSAAKLRAIELAVGVPRGMT
jgi:acyl-CoA reductase-like NAD-dependent aldehyde dehydrogenase